MAKKPKAKDPRAVALGRKGGQARFRNLSAVERSELARKAVNARWEKYRREKKS